MKDVDGNRPDHPPVGIWNAETEEFDMKTAAGGPGIFGQLAENGDDIPNWVFCTEFDPMACGCLLRNFRPG